MKLVLCVLMSMLLLVLSCTSERPSTGDVQKLAAGGKKNLPKLYEIAATTEGWQVGGTGLSATFAIGSMGQSGTSFLIDLLAIAGNGRQNSAFSELVANIPLYREHRSFLALIYSTLCAPPEWRTHRQDFFRLDLCTFEGINEDSSLPEVCLWWLRESRKFPHQILPKQWSKSAVLTAIVHEIEKYPDLTKKDKDILDKTRAEIRALEQTKEPDGAR